MIGYLNAAFPVDRMQADHLPRAMNAESRDGRVSARRARTGFEKVAADRKSIAPAGPLSRTRPSELQGSRWRRRGAVHAEWRIGIVARRPGADADGEALASLRVAYVPVARQRVSAIRVDPLKSRPVATMIDQKSSHGPTRQPTAFCAARAFLFRCQGTEFAEFFQQGTSSCLNRCVKPSATTRSGHGPDRAVHGARDGA